MEFINVKLNLSEKQLKQLSKGITSAIRNEQIGHGFNVKMSRENAKKALNGLKNNKGFRLKLVDHEIHGSGLGFKQFGKQAKQALKGTFNDLKKEGMLQLQAKAQEALNQYGSGIGFKKFGKQAKQALQGTFNDVKKEAVSNLRNKANQALDGRKLLNPEMDAALQNMGIKKMIYDAGSSMKPNVAATINGQGILGKSLIRCYKKTVLNNKCIKLQVLLNL
jgi:hypothetical protein